MSKMVRRTCRLRNTEVALMAETGEDGKEMLSSKVTYCMSKAEECERIHCRYAGGYRDPFIG